MTSFPANVDQLHSILTYIRSNLSGFPDKTLLKIELACEEAVMNIINHAKVPTLEIDVLLVPQSHTAITFRDAGPPFNPLHQAPPDVSAPLDDRSPGGLGILLIRQNMDQILYARENNHNLLTLIKKFP